ncbi:MAG: Fur family transcriptional regulator [Micavibrio sp.]
MIRPKSDHSHDHHRHEDGHIRLLKKHSLSITPARLAILKALDAHPHADADTILKYARGKISTLSKQAVYDNLHVLTENHILRVIQPMGHPARYETRVCDNHHHLVCRTCGAAADVDCASHDRPCLTPPQTHGFILEEAEVIFWGLCPSCQNNSTTKP